MADVVADPDALGDFADLGSARAAMEVEAGDLSDLWSRVANGSPDFGVVGTSLGRLSSLLLDMEHQENFAAAVRAALLAADDFPGRVGRAPAALVDALLAGAPSGLLWAFDPEIALFAVDNHLSYEQAYFAVRTHQIDIVQSLIAEGGSRAGGEAQRLQLIADRNALIDDVTLGDQALAAAMIELLEAGGPDYTAADAAYDAPGVVFGASSIDEVLAALDARVMGTGEPPFDPFLIGLGTTLAAKVEAFTGADASVADPVIAGWAEAMGVTYNEVVALLRAEQADQAADGAAAGSGPEFIDVAVAGVGEVAALLSDRTLFVELETAEAGGPSPYDGRLSIDNVEAVLADPDRFDPRVVRIAQFLAANPDSFAQLDAARTGTFLHRLGEGEYYVGRGDGVIAHADAVEYPTTRWLFDTLRSDLASLDGDGDGVLTESEFTDRLADLDVPDDVRTAIEYALETGVADGGDVRPVWLQAASSTYRIASLFPGTPVNVGRSLVDLGGLNADSAAALRGAGGTIVGVARFGYDVGAANPSTGLYQIEAWRVGGDLERHRGVQLTQSLPLIYEASASLMPGTDQWAEASEAVRRSGTWDAHPGLNLVRTAVDEETFLEDPGAWIGALTPELLITAFTGGGGAITRTASTATRLSAAGRRFLVGLSQTGARATLGQGVSAATIGLRSVSTLPARASARMGEWAGDLQEFGLRMQSYVELHRLRRAAPAPIDFTARRDPFGRWAARRSDVDPDGYFDVVAHGNAWEIEVPGVDQAQMATAAEAARSIGQADGYQPGQPIRLLSCATGCLDDGFAAQLAQHLDAPVLGADDYLWVTRRGAIAVSRAVVKQGLLGERLVPDWPPTGNWRLFHPDGRIETVEVSDDESRSFGRVRGAGQLQPRDPSEAIADARTLIAALHTEQAPSPSLEPPTGMTQPLVEIRGSLVDPRLIVAFDDKYEALGAAKLERIYDEVADFEAMLMRGWGRGHPSPPALTQERARLLDELALMRGTRQEIANEVQRYASDNPDVAGTHRLLADLAPTDRSLRALSLGEKDLSAEVLTSMSGANGGVLGELLTAQEVGGVSEFRKVVFLDGQPSEIDIVANSGAVWIDAKTGAPFGLNSSSWTELRKQARRLIEVAAHPGQKVAGTSPTVVYVFRDGVSRDVRNGLLELGAEFGIRVDVRSLREVS